MLGIKFRFSGRAISTLNHFYSQVICFWWMGNMTIYSKLEFCGVYSVCADVWRSEVNGRWSLFLPLMSWHSLLQNLELRTSWPASPSQEHLSSCHFPNRRLPSFLHENREAKLKFLHWMASPLPAEPSAQTLKRVLTGSCKITGFQSCWSLQPSSQSLPAGKAELQQKRRRWQAHCCCCSLCVYFWHKSATKNSLSIKIYFNEVIFIWLWLLSMSF